VRTRLRTEQDRRAQRHRVPVRTRAALLGACSAAGCCTPAGRCCRSGPAPSLPTMYTLPDSRHLASNGRSDAQGLRGGLVPTRRAAGPPDMASLVWRAGPAPRRGAAGAHAAGAGAHARLAAAAAAGSRARRARLAARVPAGRGRGPARRGRVPARGAGRRAGARCARALRQVSAGLRLLALVCVVVLTRRGAAAVAQRRPASRGICLFLRLPNLASGLKERIRCPVHRKECGPEGAGAHCLHGLPAGPRGRPGWRADVDVEVGTWDGRPAMRRRAPYQPPAGGVGAPPGVAALGASEALGAGRAFAAMLLPADAACAPGPCSCGFAARTRRTMSCQYGVVLRFRVALRLPAWGRALQGWRPGRRRAAQGARARGAGARRRPLLGGPGRSTRLRARRPRLLGQGPSHARACYRGVRQGARKRVSPCTGCRVLSFQDC